MQKLINLNLNTKAKQQFPLQYKVTAECTMFYLVHVNKINEVFNLLINDSVELRLWYGSNTFQSSSGSVGWF